MTAEMRERVPNWTRLMEVRDRVLKELEVKRQEKFIGAPLEARVRIAANGDLYPLLAAYSNELPGLFIVSQVQVTNTPEADLAVTVERADGVKCERCWKYTKDVGSDPTFPTVCAPCADAVRQILG
jgi:isoleucyl-tRNA synthetase